MSNLGHGLENLSPDKHFLIAGGDGHMGTFYNGLLDFTHPDSAVIPLDLNRLGNNVEIAKKAMDSNFRSLVEEGRNRIGVLALPFRIFDKANRIWGDRDPKDQRRAGALKDMIGISNRGARNDCLVSLTSSLNIPLSLMDSFSGMALGVHHMHKPPFPRHSTLKHSLDYDHGRSFEEQKEELLQKLRRELVNRKVVITATESKKAHDRYPHYEEWWTNFLKEIGYEKIITDLSPEEHDRMMSSVQFLTHNMYLVGGMALEPFRENVSEDETPVAHAILQVVRRMLTMAHETYQGIATENEFNEEIFALWSKEAGKIKAVSVEDLAKKLVFVTQAIARDYLAKLNVSDATKKTLGTPVSELRDNLLAGSDTQLVAGSLDEGEIDLRDGLEAYKSVLNDPEGLYGKFFEELRRLYPDFEANESARIMSKYQALARKK